MLKTIEIQNYRAISRLGKIKPFNYRENKMKISAKVI